MKRVRQWSRGQESLLPGSAGSIYQRIYQYTGGRNHTDRSGNSAYGCGGKKLIPEKKHPQIALIGFESMFSDTSYFDELFGITLKTYFMKSMEQAAEKVELMIAEGQMYFWEEIQ